ncbi:MAG: hydantoinase B/oxoprolinase family protein [Albidovulum sp.]|nr:hydantoinase B/oxoprolinase family protein [Albidovulum sp.]
MTAIDPITVEVVGSSLNSVVEEMGEALVRASYSTNIKERRDCSTALFDKRGFTICQAEHIPMHLGSIIEFIPYIIESCGTDEIRPGDVFMGNDAYAGGATHLPDIVLAEPIFFERELVAWAINTAHHADFADRGHSHIFQEGIRIPPVRLYREGVLQEDLREVFLLNCQVPRERLSDINAQLAANRLGARRLNDLFAKYGREQMLAAWRALQDYSERKMRAGIAAIPDGVYRFSDTFDSNQYPASLEFDVAIGVEGDSMVLDFNAPAQVSAGLNMVYTSLLSACYYSVKSAVDPTILPNSGLARPLRIAAPKGSILNCVHPAAVDGRIAACQRVADLVHGALSQAIPDKVAAAGNGCCTGAIFNGVRSNGELWVYLETIGGGGGARPTGDGMSGIQVHLTNTSNLPVEAMEREYPLTLLRYELVDGSAGPGEFRGGMGIRRMYRVEEACRFVVEGSRLRSRPWGLAGGRHGAGSRFDLGDGPGAFSGTRDLEPGQIVAIETPGGGGYGPPADRSRAMARADLLDGRICKDEAHHIYGLEDGR